MNKVDVFRKHIEGAEWVVADLLKYYASYEKTWKQVYRATLLTEDAILGNHIINQRCFTRDEYLASVIMSTIADEPTCVILEVESVRGISLLEVFNDLVDEGYEDDLADLKNLVEMEDEIVSIDTKFQIVEKTNKKIRLKTCIK